MTIFCQLSLHQRDVAERVLRALVVGAQLEHALEGAHRLVLAQELVGEQLALLVVEVGAAALVGLDAELEIDEPHHQLEVAALAMDATRFAERAPHGGIGAAFVVGQRRGHGRCRHLR